ncbi:MAG TPA: phosphotransferase [Candidatus Angelobacter sp.]|nr:phosphotransferase [Candidatus Angelobacter sp.]
MPETVLDQVIIRLRDSAPQVYPDRSEIRNIRVVGHTPKTDHFIYDASIDFVQGSERIAIKVYRANKCGGNVKAVARQENGNLQFVQQASQKKKLGGVPRVLGDFSEFGAVVTEKIPGLPLQSIIMKAALLPGFADNGSIALVARRAGEWLRSFHKATADMPEPFDGAALLTGLEKLCQSCIEEGLDERSVRVILNGTKSVLGRAKKSLPSSAVLADFTPLNVVVTENGVGFCDFARMKRRGNSFEDLALFLASVEALEKYPFCNRSITSQIQESFLDAYGISQSESAILRVLKMKALLGMFAQGRTVKESAARKKVMWANVMKKFIHQAAQRSLAPAAA